MAHSGIGSQRKRAPTSEPTTTSSSLAPFNPSQYYVVGTDQKISDEKNNLQVIPLQKGRELVEQYYAKKYRTNISFPRDNSSYVDTTSFVFDINKYLTKAREKKEDHRQAFLLGAEATHAIPIIYVREDGKEAILYADSKGINEWNIQQITDTGLKVYAIKEPRQSDSYSCYSDALVFGRDTTAKNKDGSYKIPTLLSALKSSEKKEKNYYSTKLPDELLKTSQIKEFTDYHTERSDRKIHKNETIDQFRKRYTENAEVKSHTKNERKNISTYLRKKGIKYADIIEIQFYINELSREAGTLWSDEIRKNFIDQAKNELLKQQLSSENQRKGLYDFSKIFLDQVRIPIKDDSVAPSGTSRSSSSVLISEKKPEENLMFNSITTATKSTIVGTRNNLFKENIYRYFMEILKYIAFQCAALFVPFGLCFCPYIQEENRHKNRPH